MDKTKYCEQLLKYQKEAMPLRLFLGGKWIFLKVVILAGGIFLLISQSVVIKVWGGFAIGYALGKIAAGIGSYKVSKLTWEYTKDLLDWNKVSESANNKS
jgi:hypothetical protein